MIQRLILILAVCCFAACDDETAPDQETGYPIDCYDGGCTTSSLPLSQSADGPVLVEVKLECQPASIVVLATVTDPQGTDNLLGIMQTIGVFPDEDCEGVALEVEDDLAGSGLEESFGDVVLESENPTLYERICPCASWPVEVRFEDRDGNVTTGVVLATVIE